jgi:hypothetical protein
MISLLILSNKKKTFVETRGKKTTARLNNMLSRVARNLPKAFLLVALHHL